MMNYKVLASIFISLFLGKQLQACGGGWYSSSYYNIYEQNLMLADRLDETHHRSRDYDNSWFNNSNIREDNLKEWQVFFNNKYDVNFIEDLIYNEDNLSERGIELKLKYSDDKTKNGFSNYLMFAKDCEEVSTAADPWSYYDDKEETVNMVLINRLVKEGESKIRMEKNPFLKERFNFQLMKLYYYGKRYKKAIETYDIFYEDSESKSIMKYWSLDYKAGAQMQLDQTAEANSNFLTVFDNCPSRRSTAYYSITFSDQEGFEEVLSWCKTPKEKAVFHFVRGVNQNAVVLEDLKAVLEFSPNSDYAKVLMANELVKMEHIYWQREEETFYGTDVKDLPLDQLMAYITEFRLLTQNSISKLEDKAFWNISLAYLYSLEKNYEASNLLLSSINTSNEAYKEQIEKLELLNYIYLHPELSKSDEDYIGTKWLAINNGAYDSGKFSWYSGDFNEFLTDYFYYYFKDNANKAFLFSGQTADTYKDEYDELLHAGVIYDLRMGLESNKQTKLLEYGEKCFLQGSIYEDISAELKEVEATLLMRNPDELESAIALFKELDTVPEIEYNPFNMGIRDCIGGGWYDENGCNHKTSVLNKLSLAEKLLVMRNKTLNEESAMDAYLLANAYYNMTYYGFEWGALSYYRSGSYTTGFSDCSTALGLYEKAIDLFEGNKEMQAKASFMAAKCEQNLYFDYEDEDGWGYEIAVNWKDPLKGVIDYNADIEGAGYRTHFKTLESDYKDTKFYQEIIQECSYFDIYVHY